MWTVGLLIVVAVAVRSAGVGRPLVGQFATKNTIYAMVARNWVCGEAPLRYPTIDCLRAGKPSLHMLEFPASAYLTGLGWWAFGGSLDVWGRSTSIAFSAASVVLLYALVRRRHGPDAALGAAATLALSPVSIVYGQSFMLEASLVFFAVATLYGLERWTSGGSPAWLLVVAAGWALLLLTKVFMIVLLAPVLAMAWGSVRTMRGWAALLVTLAVANVPAAAWYWHAAATAAPESPLAPHVFYSVRESVESHLPPHPLLSQPEFYRQLLDDLSGVVLTPLGLGLAVLGFLRREWRERLAWLAASLVLVVLLPRKFFEMNYYWMALLPGLSIAVGLGWRQLQAAVQPSRASAAALLLLVLAFSLRYAYRPAFVTPDEDRSVVVAAEAVRELAEPGDRVVAIHGTTLDLLYYCDRRGWVASPREPDFERQLGECRREAARWVVVSGPDFHAIPPAVKADWEPVGQGADWGVYRLPADPVAGRPGPP